MSEFEFTDEVVGRWVSKAVNSAVATLLKQGCRSADEDGCRYRGPEGRVCAIGAMIPDHLYFEGLEHRGARDAVVLSIVISALGLSSELALVPHDPDALQHPDVRTLADLLCAMQEIHDKHPVHRWAAEYVELFEEYGITPNFEGA